MKKLFLVLIFLLVSFGIASATDLRWDASTGIVDGYNVYYTDEITDFNFDAGNVLEILDIDTNLQLLADTTYTFTMKAYNNVGESPVSNTVIYTTTEGYTPPPNNIPISITAPTIITITIE